MIAGIIGGLEGLLVGSLPSTETKLPTGVIE